MRKLEVSSSKMSEEGATTVLAEIETLIAGYIAERGLRRMIKIKGGK
jgi:hypothetical protein